MCFLLIGLVLSLQVFLCTKRECSHLGWIKLSDSGMLAQLFILSLFLLLRENFLLLTGGFRDSACFFVVVVEMVDALSKVLETTWRKMQPAICTG